MSDEIERIQKNFITYLVFTDFMAPDNTTCQDYPKNRCLLFNLAPLSIRRKRNDALCILKIQHG